MRIVHITDLHYSIISNEYEFEPLFEALLSNLVREQEDKKIDLILITGDLVDKGGKNIKGTNHYDVVLKVVITPLMERLQLKKKQIIMIPGNHDVCEKPDVDNNYLKGLRSDIDIPAVNTLVEKNKDTWNKPDIDGLKKYKEFEKAFYSKTKSSGFKTWHSNFETGFIYKIGEAQIGIAGFNSAWSCNTALDKNPKYKLAFGTSQILRINKFFKGKTDFNIALLHHPINAGIYSEQEEKEMKKFLSDGNFNMLFCGHTHEAKDNFIKEPDATYYLIVTKASLNNPRMDVEKYKSGYCLVDLTYCSDEEITVTRHFRKYFHPGRFDFDTDDATRAQTSLQIRPNHVGSKFIRYLKTQAGKFDPERKALMDTISSFSQHYIKSPFPDIIGEALKSSFERFLPAESDFNYIRKDLKLHWEIKYHSDKYYHFNEEQTFKIISSKEEFVLKHSVYIDTVLDGNDKATIALKKYSINGKDKSKNFKPLNTPLPREGTFGRERKRLILEEPLKGKEEYKIESYFEAINSLTTAKAWSFRRKNIVQGYEITIEDVDDRYRIELFGVGTDTYYSNIDETGKKKKKIVVSQPDQLLAPGMEFWLFVSSY